MIDQFLDGRTISSLVGEVDSRMRDGHSSEELAVLALLRRGLEERAPRHIATTEGGMTGRDDLPAHVREASEAGQRAWIEAYDEELEDHGDEARARAAADAVLAEVDAET